MRRHASDRVLLRLPMLVALAVVVVLVAGCTSDGGGTDAVEAATVVVEPFATEVVVTSPDGSLAAEVGLDELGRPRYRIVRSTGDAEAIVVEDSTLGLEATTAEGSRRSFASGATQVSAGSAQRISDSFSLPTGKAREATVDAVRQTVQFNGFAHGDALGVEFWVADTAVAFRYLVGAETGATMRIEWERTSFALPENSRAWLQPHDAPGRYTPAYERLRSRVAPADDPGRSSFGWTFPALFESEAGWTLITETALDDGDAGSHLSSVVADGEYFVDLADRAEGNGVGDPRPNVSLPWQSPWRLIVTSPEIGDIVESDHVRHLSRSSAPDADFGWVEPGRVSWSWWSDHASSRDADAMEPFIDFAALMGWEYSLIDANWNTFSDERLVDLVDRAASQDVKLLLWYNSGGRNNVVTEAPRDRMADQAKRREEFDRLAGLGIAGVKVDFFHSDKPDRIAQYRSILSDAAASGLLVNFHGSTVPRGWSREFPNLMTMEAVRGAEIYTFDAGYAAAAPRQNTVLPFTRNVVGSMDYTPVIVGDTVRRLTTNSHELALSVVFESGLQHFVDTPEAYRGQPPEVVTLLQTVPTVWDETRFIEGAPESHVVIARRNGDVWWIGAISALDEPVSVTVDLNTLGLDTATPLLQVCDAPDWDEQPGRRLTWDDPTQYSIANRLIADPGAADGDRLVLDIEANGGCLSRVG